MRARERFLGVAGDDERMSNLNLSDLQQIGLRMEVAAHLRRQLTMPGRLRGGPLFGAREAKKFDVMVAGSPGMPHWYSHTEHPALDIDERYILGWSECLEVIYGKGIDWIGNWLAYPDSQLGEGQKDLECLLYGSKFGLFDQHHFLMIIGWSNRRLAARAYFRDDGDDVSIPVTLR